MQILSNEIFKEIKYETADLSTPFLEAKNHFIAIFDRAFDEETFGSMNDDYASALLRNLGHAILCFSLAFPLINTVILLALYKAQKRFFPEKGILEKTKDFVVQTTEKAVEAVVGGGGAILERAQTALGEIKEEINHLSVFQNKPNLPVHPLIAHLPAVQAKTPSQQTQINKALHALDAFMKNPHASLDHAAEVALGLVWNMHAVCEGNNTDTIYYQQHIDKIYGLFNKLGLNPEDKKYGIDAISLKNKLPVDLLPVGMNHLIFNKDGNTLYISKQPHVQNKCIEDAKVLGKIITSEKRSIFDIVVDALTIQGRQPLRDCSAPKVCIANRLIEILREKQLTKYQIQEINKFYQEHLQQLMTYGNKKMTEYLGQLITEKLRS